MYENTFLNVYPNKLALHVGKTDVDPDWDSVGGISAADDQLRLDVGADEPEQFCEQHEDYEDNTADGNDSPGDGGLGQILRNLAVNVHTLYVERHLEGPTQSENWGYMFQ